MAQVVERILGKDEVGSSSLPSSSISGNNSSPIFLCTEKFMNIIAHIQNDYTSKFGVPRQSGLVNEEESLIIFEPEYRVAEAIRGLDNFNYIWLIWEFSEVKDKEWSPTVRPPRLGGNKRVGVFATRSPFRPNSIGLSSVKIKCIKKTEKYGYVIKVQGADLMNGTPIYDIKPYLPYADCHTDASNGFADTEFKKLSVIIPESIENIFPKEKLNALIATLEQDPRPQYIDDPSREFGLTFAEYNIKFTVTNNILTVKGITKI
jgi:tRNA (adenine37-N6)-methyltransferase